MSLSITPNVTTLFNQILLWGSSYFFIFPKLEEGPRRMSCNTCPRPPPGRLQAKKGQKSSLFAKNGGKLFTRGANPNRPSPLGHDKSDAPILNMGPSDGRHQAWSCADLGRENRDFR
jgi:hypothetical protein